VGAGAGPGAGAGAPPPVLIVMELLCVLGTTSPWKVESTPGVSCWLDMARGGVVTVWAAAEAVARQANARNVVFIGRHSIAALRAAWLI